MSSPFLASPGYTCTQEKKKGWKTVGMLFMTYSWEHRTLFFSGRKLGIEVNGAKQVNVQNFYLNSKGFKFFFQYFSQMKKSSGKRKV